MDIMMGEVPKGFYPDAVIKNIPPGSNDPQIIPTTAILHVDAGNAESLYTYFRDRSGGIESHFHILKNGRIEQYRSIYYEADANYKANPFAVSIETQGFAKEPWTDEQLASIKKLLIWLHKDANIKLQRPKTWHSGGVGYHIQFGSPGYWTNVAKSCPGPKRIKQYDTVIIPWMKAFNRPLMPTRVSKAQAHIDAAIALLRDVPTRRKAAHRLRAELESAQDAAPKR